RGNGTLGKIALDETKAADAAGWTKAGGAWEEFASSADELPRIQALLHAYQLYLQALPTQDAAGAAAVHKSLANITKALPAEYRAGEITTELKKIDLPGPVYSAAFSPDARKIVAAAYDGSLRVFDTRTGKELR